MASLEGPLTGPDASAEETRDYLDQALEWGDPHPAPDWIPRPDGALPGTWDRYLRSQPGSGEHKAAYTDMHREAGGEGFADPDPDRSYLADHGYEADVDRWFTPESIENGAEPDDAYRPDEPGPDAANWGPELDAPDHHYGIGRELRAYEAGPPWEIADHSGLWMPSGRESQLEAG